MPDVMFPFWHATFDCFPESSLQFFVIGHFLKQWQSFMYQYPASQHNAQTRDGGRTQLRKV